MASAEAAAGGLAQAGLVGAQGDVYSEGGEADGEPPWLAIEVVVGLSAGQVWHSALRLPAGATVADALRSAGVLQRLGAATLDGLQLSLWGRACAPDGVLRTNDRVELTRGLRVDPKEARRQRYRRDGLRKPQRRG